MLRRACTLQKLRYLISGPCNGNYDVMFVARRAYVIIGANDSRAGG
jgi:hypothetical protein